MATNRFLKTVRGWFRPVTPMRSIDPTVPQGQAPTGSGPCEPAPQEQALRDPQPGPGLLRWTGGNRQQALERLQAGYDRMVGLCQTIDEHLKSQQEQGHHAGECLGRLSESIDRVPDLLDQLGQRLDRIADQTSKAFAGTERLSDAIEQLVPAQRSQNDLLSCVHRQLGESAHTNAQLSDVLVELKNAMQGMSRSEADRIRVIERMAETLASRDREFTEVIQQQNKAFKWAWAGSLSAAAAAIAIALVALLR